MARAVVDRSQRDSAGVIKPVKLIFAERAAGRLRKAQLQRAGGPPVARNDGRIVPAAEPRPAERELLRQQKRPVGELSRELAVERPRAGQGLASPRVEPNFAERPV